jgi:MFS family permease
VALRRNMLRYNSFIAEQIMVKPDRHRKLVRLGVILLAFVSGFVIMAIELLGGRLLSPYFGSSVYVWGSIITVFMIALALGYLSGGKLSTRNPNAFTFSMFYLYAAIAILPIIFLADMFMNQVFLVIEDPRYGSLVAAMLLFFIPICILGMVAPYSVRLLVKTEEHSGHMAGLLYFVSTLGSALGTLATSFYLVLYFEVNQILWALLGALLISGLAMMLLQKDQAPVETP